MATEVLARSEDGTINFIILTPTYLQRALDVIRTSFFTNENICKAVKISESPIAMAELEKLTLNAAYDGVSVVAIDKRTDTVVGVAFNKLQVKDTTGDGTYFENFAKSCQHPSSRKLVEFMIDVDAKCDLFELCQADCLLEIMYLATSHQYWGKGIGRKLCEISIEMARKLRDGVNVKKSLIPGQTLSLEPVPKLVSAIFTSFISQKIGRQLEFEIATTIPYDKFTYDGQSFARVIGNASPYTTLEYKKL